MFEFQLKLFLIVYKFIYAGADGKMYDVDNMIKDIIKVIRENNYKRVLIQLPEGLKPFAKDIQDAIYNQIDDVELIFWLNSNYGACDTIDIDLKRFRIDAIIHVGHARYINTAQNNDVMR